MDLRLQPKPKVEDFPPTRGIISRKQFFVKKKFERIKKYFFSGHLIRDWKPKAELIYPPFTNESAIQYEYDFNRDAQNCFVEDYAEEVYLRTPPPCFVIIGKCGRSISKLSQEIANEFGSVLIQVDDIVNQVIKRKTETSKILERLLRLGCSLTLNFILALLSYVAHTAEARHRGYVLCGLPRAPLLQDLSVEQQFNYLFTWENRPTVFINVLFDDEDLFKERTNLFCEIENAGSENYILYHSEWENCQEDEDKTDEDENDDLLPIKEDIFYERDIDISPSRPWVRLPKDEDSRVWSELELFDNEIRPVIELINSRVDPQYFITVDSRIGNEFEVILARLRLLQIWKVPVAELLIQPPQNEELMEQELNEDKKEEKLTEIEYDPDIKEIIEEPPETAFLKLFVKKAISPKYRWELSHYNYVCPVSLREGEILEGKSEFAVLFMKYIYFLRDKESALKFIQNPRAYALPIRPKPLCRFFILGYPYSGKTTLAENLADKFSIPVINFNTVLKNDLERKKSVYQEFCRQKAECREIIRLTARAWQDWRMEEEQRLRLIEDWILFVQVLLSKRIKEFYSTGSEDSATATEIRKESSSAGISVMPECTCESNDISECLNAESAVEVRETTIEAKTDISKQLEGTIAISTSVKIRQVTKCENVKKESKEMEANLVLSSLWKSFSGEKQKPSKRRHRSAEEYGEMDDYEQSSENTFDFDDVSDEFDVVDWCSLLPPQSLSSFLLTKKPFTARQKRESFHIFLEAASKAYWTPSSLKSQFAKWRIPCFMDITLCEIYLDNPLLLLTHIPSWLKERPLIPDPIDPKHPSVLEAGRKAFLRAGCVKIQQNQEEVGVLLRDAIEKAEREGMRVTGEVISPGGWVVDDMTLDLNVWNKLASENIFGDHIYILVDSEPEWRRILNTWWDFCGRFRDSIKDIRSDEYEEEGGETDKESECTENLDQKQGPQSSTALQEITSENKTLVQLLIDRVRAIAEGDEQLDDIYKALVFDTEGSKKYISPFLMDVFCLSMLQNAVEINKEDSLNEEALLTIQTLTQTFSEGIRSSGLFVYEEKYPSISEFSLGVPLEIFTEVLLNMLKKKETQDEFEMVCNESFENSLEFFVFLLTLPQKLNKLKEWLSAIGRDFTIDEIDITEKSQEEVFSYIYKNLMMPFIKKPRELEKFEIEEIDRSNERILRQLKMQKEQSEAETVDMNEEEGEEEEQEDVCIFGESGKLCVVNLERDIFLYGKPEFALRYYGKLYYFWDEECKNKFIENPEKYAPYYSAIRCYPPLRAFVMGPTGCGKSTLAQCLANQCSNVLVDYLKYTIQRLIPHLQCLCKKFMSVGDKKLLLGENHSPEAKLAKEHFMTMSFNKRLYWSENCFYSDYTEVEKFFDKVLKNIEPVRFKSLPNLTYMTIESIPEENDEEYADFPSKTEFNMPEIPYISMKEIESIVSNYLYNSGELSDNLLSKSFSGLWTREPYMTQGFILDGFPLRFSDIQTIVKNNWIPDIIIEISATADNIIDRNVDALLEFWDTKLKQEIMEEKLIEDSLNCLQTAFLSLKRNELMKEKREELIRIMESQVSEDSGQLKKVPNEDVAYEEQYYLKDQKSDDLKIGKIFSKPSIKKYEKLSDPDPFDKFDSEIIDEVDKTLREKYPLFNFNPIFENYDDGKARIISNLIEAYRADMSEMDKIRNALKDIDVSWFEIDATLSVEEATTDLFLKFDRVRNKANRKGEFAFTISMNRAESLLQQGYYFLSKFGKWCPVQVYRMKNPIHMFRPLYPKGKITPIVYRNYVYFVAGEHERRKFLEDPIKFTFNEPHHPNIPLRIAVIGPPKSGKSTLCKRLKAMFDLKVITMGSALRFALENTPRSTLAKSITSYLRRGCFLPLSLKIEALLLCLNDPSCITQGFVLDGMPFDAAFTQSLAEKGKLPFVIIHLVADSYFGKTNRQNLDLTQFRLPYKNRTNLDTRYNDWNQTYKRFAQWNEDTYNNLYEVNAKLSVVDIFYQAYDIIRKSFFGILYYVEYCVSDRALPLQYLCVSQHEYELRKSPLQNSCPVCWVELNKLNCSFDPPPRSGLFQYLNHFYWVCPTHFEKFLKNPKIYFPPHAKKWPELFPRRLQRNKIEKILPQLKLHGFGRCPVTRTDFPSHLDWEGSLDFAVLYGNEVYLCKNEDMITRFLAKPWRYCNADTQYEVNRPIKSNAVEELGPPKITSLPPIGFLEQTIADLIHECLQILGVVRPLYPNISPTATGCTFVALYLKVNNKKTGHSHLEKDFLNYMLRYCQPNLFIVSSVRYPQDKQEIADAEDIEPEDANELESSTESSTISEVSVDVKKSTSDPCWVDPELQTDRKMWSASYISEKLTEMKITPEDKLLEIPEVPKVHVALNYQTYTLRSNPLPPVTNCLTFLYSCKLDIEIPESFSYHTLHQPLQLFSSPFMTDIMFNPDKQFSHPLYKKHKPNFPSKPDLRKAERAIPDPLADKIKIEKQLNQTDPVFELLSERFFPRFQLLDKIKIPQKPPIPKASETEPLHFNPHREYAYTILFSEFFRTSHVLRCYEWSECSRFLEYSDRLEKNLGLSKVTVDYIFKPRKPASLKSRTSIDSYQQVFDAACKFLVTSDFSDSDAKSEEDTSNEAKEKQSLINFFQMLIFEKFEQLFKKVSDSSLSYDAFDIAPSEAEGSHKPSIAVREVLPYPPLPWDIISRPYNSYVTIATIFGLPPMENIAHKRHISLLDGLTELHDDLKFVSYPPPPRDVCERNRGQGKGGITPVYFFYDFFNLPWTSFLPYPYSIAYNTDMTNYIVEKEE